MVGRHRDLVDHLFRKVVSIPGADWRGLVVAIQNDADIRDGTVYLIIGPVRHTRLRGDRSVREVMRTRPSRTIQEEMNWIRTRLAPLNLLVVFCPQTPMHFLTYNRSISRTGNLGMQAWYAEWQEGIEGAIAEENGEIVGNNREAGVHTPFIEKWVIRRRRRHSVKTTYRRLRDGLHPSRDLVRLWAGELQKNIAMNTHRQHFDRRRRA